MAVADWSGDAQPDILTGKRLGVSGHSGPVPPGFIETGVTWAHMTVGDVDSDGLLDIVTAPGGVTVLWGCQALGPKFAFETPVGPAAIREKPLPRHERGFPESWLPETATSANFSSSFVIDARARFKRRSKTKKPPQILATLDRAEEACRRLDAGGVKQADLAREWGLTHARITQLVKLGHLCPAVRAWVREHAQTVRIGERKLRRILGLPAGRQMAALLEQLEDRGKRAAAR